MKKCGNNQKSGISAEPTSLLEAVGKVDIVTRDIDDDFNSDLIRSRIFTIRGVQVMLAPDLADLYQVETRIFNQSVKRNIKRFPVNFRFQLTKDELDGVITNCDNPDRLRFAPATPYAFTEQGIAMLSGVLNSDIAVQVSIRIMNTFVAMRRALSSIAPLLSRLESTERRQLKLEDLQVRNEERFDTIFKAMDGGEFPPQKVFFEGKHYDAYSFAKKLVRKAARKIVLVDGYCDDVTLDILAQKKGGVEVLVATAQKMIDKHLTPVAVAKFNKQNPALSVKAVGAFHDRFLILDDKELYHFGASLKDLGRQYCAITKMDPVFIPSVLQRI